MREVAVLLTGAGDAEPEDGIAWLRDLTTALSIPSLASYGLAEADMPLLVAAAQHASSMRGNPVELTDAEVEEMISRSL